jgi:hypothetical protein
LDARVDGEQLAEISLTINLTVYDLSEAAMSTAGYWVGPVSQKDSSLYFTVSDAAMGPTSGVWWDNHTHGPNTLAVPIQDDATGKSTLLNLDAYKVACDYWWDFNSAQAAHNGPCDNYAVLYVNGDNTHLDAGHSYSSPNSSPLIINAMRWHSPNPYTLIETFPLQVTYTAP